ncbi:hypothetical protein UCDDA912_g02251 [Diaporthe ampelina]|uniref:Uncharacterized protein n=1 Tax=Diaporthe ampelina TaxID=1214573 RepID=A0A0G2FU91_9PEZI|nr:hypothetical protein UCDDA912_g02251 [Diaporthe ampelina]
MATSRSTSFQGNQNGQRTEPEHYQLRANEFDQATVWFQNMEDPNEAFRGPPGNGHRPALDEFTLAPGHGSHNASLQSSGSNNHGNVHAPRHTSLNPSTGGLKTQLDAANAENLWNVNANSANVNHNFSQSFNAQGSQRWPPVPCPSNEYIQAYGFPEGLAHGLPMLPNNQAVGPSFDLGQAMNAVPNVDGSSSSSCPVNGSSPNTVFGSFSSSIGPRDMMDMDVTEECFHSPSVFPSEVSACHNPGTIPQAFLSRPADNNLGIHPALVFPEAETVSPKMLHLNNAPSLPSSSSSESLPNPFRMDSDTEVASAVAVPQDAALSSSSQQAKPGAGPKVNTAPRKLLPDKPPRAKASTPSSGPKRRHGGEAAGDKASAPSSKKSKAKPRASSQSKPQSKSDSHHHHHHHHQRHKGGPDPGAKTAHGKASPSKAATTSTNSSGASVELPVTPPRSERDEFLVQSKLAGMTYKEIRKQGNFTEAESTLRGRFRTLTKPKEARVRKPEFQEIDDKLLRRAVVKFTKDVDEITRDNVPWKLVSEYMFDHGGSYLFGYTTVRKRWEYLMVTSEEQVKQDRLDHQFQL